MNGETITSAQVPAGSVARGAVTAAIFRAAAMLIGFLNMFVLMRLLSPADFGIVDMVATLTVFLSIGGNLGLGAATVQSRQITHAQLSTLFWINTAFGFLVWALCTALGPLIAWFYKEPVLFHVVALMGMTFFWGGLSAQSYALLQRNMRFVRMGVAEISSLVAGMCVAVFMAWSGFRYWAIACGSLTTSVVNSVAAMALAGFVPGLPKRGTGVRAKLRYGGWLVGFNFLNYFNRNLDHVMVGWACGKEDLGYYARAYKLYLLPLTFINAVAGQVMFPVLSRIQDDRKRLAETYAGLLGILIVTACTLAAWMGILAEEIMSLFGPQWMPAVPVFRILAVVGVIQPIVNVSGVGYLATAATRTMFFWCLFATPIYATAFALGAYLGMTGVAFGYVLSLGLLSVPGVYVVLRTIHVSPLYVAKETAVPLVVLVLSTCVVFAARQVTCLLGLDRIPLLVATGILGIGTHLALLRLLYLTKIRTWARNMMDTATHEPLEAGNEIL